MEIVAHSGDNLIVLVNTDFPVLFVTHFRHRHRHMHLQDICFRFYADRTVHNDHKIFVMFNACVINISNKPINQIFITYRNTNCQLLI
jgi:hypothetical protein